MRSAIGRRSLLRLLIAIALATGSGAHARANGPPVIAVASSVQAAATEIAAAFEAATGDAVTLSFGASGNFARQIRQGAPFELFLSADEVFVEDLARDGFAQGDGAIYATGRLALVVPRGGALRADATLDDLADALAKGRVARFAIASPEHAPYGQRAAEALRHRGLWEAIAPHLIYGENVAQAAQFAISGSADGGIVAQAQALAPAVAARAETALIPSEWHAPLGHRMALLNGAGPVAAAFYAYLQGPQAREILARNGLAPPPAPS